MEKLLCDLCHPKQWKTISSSMLQSTGYPVYGANGIIGYYSEYNHALETLLITCRGATCGTLNICKPFSYVNGNAMALDDLSSEVDLHYLYYYLSARGLSDVITGSAQPQIVRQSLNKVRIVYPSLAQQHQIVTVLVKVTNLMSQRRAQLEKLDLLVKSRFVEMFGDLTNPNCPYKKYKLVDVCADSDDIKCGPFGTQLSKQEYQDHGVALWEIPQINSYFSTPPTHFLTQEKAAQLNAFSIIPGDIVMSRKGNVGRCALFPSHFDNGIMHSDVLRIRVDKQRVNPCFMMYQLHFSRAVQHQIEVVSTGAIMAGVNVTKLKNIVIHLPDLDQQESFCSFVQKKDMLKNSINESLKYLGILKQSLMQQYFE